MSHIALFTSGFTSGALGSILEEGEGGWCAVATRVGFTGQTAPCGSVVDGTRYHDSDDEGMRVEHIHYGCGCQDLRDDFHDGSTHRRVVHHSGKLLLDEELRGE